MSIPSVSTEPLSYLGGDLYSQPSFINAMRAPTIQDIYTAGTRWQNNAVSPFVIYQTTGAGIWYIDSGSGGSFTSLAVTGASNLTGTTNINTSGAGVTSIGTGGTGATNIGNATGGTVFTGNATWGTATQGPVLTAVTASGASPQAVNGRAFAVTFTGVSIAADATQSFVIQNSTITGAGTVVLYTQVGATAGAALTIQSVTNAAGQSTVVVTNGTGATTTTANITFIGLVLN
jgi:hypothetical protein